MNQEQFTNALISDKVVANLQDLYAQFTKIHTSTPINPLYANTCTISSYSTQSIYVQDINLLIPADVWITLRLIRLHRDPGEPDEIKVIELVNIEIDRD